MEVWQQDPSPKKKAIECETRLSLRLKTIFANFRLLIRKFVLLICFWVDGLENQVVGRYLQLTTKTVCKWAEKCHQVVYDQLFSHSEKIGGPGVIVEVDESMFGRLKYHRGNRVDGQWVFGGIEANTGKSFFIPVADRKESTLIPIVKDWMAGLGISFFRLKATLMKSSIIVWPSKTLRLVPTQLHMSPPGGT